jgi:hypothetical protein
MVDRSIRTRKALVHSIPISEVKDMKSDILGAMKESLSEKKLWTLFVGLIFFQIKKGKLHRLWISSCNISAVGIKKKLKFVSNSVSFHLIPIPTYWFFRSIKIKFLKKKISF